MTVVAPPEKYTPKDFTSDQEIRWCPGCGDYAIVKAVRATLAEIGTPPHEIVFISGIGCAARFPYYMATRSEEHTSELQSLMRISYAVFCLKKKKQKKKTPQY